MLILSILQIQLNNFFNVVIDLSINEINYDFKIREALFNITKQQVIDLSIQRIEYRKKTTNVIVFVNAKFKIYYDFRHVSLMFKIDDQVYLRLHYDYQFFDRFDKIISQQRCDFFIIKRRIDRLIYELKLLFVWRVHFIISVAQFEFVSKNENLYRRSRHIYFEAIEMKNDIFQFRFYEVEKLIKKRVRKYNIIEITQYMIRWLDYDFEYDEWNNLFVLHNYMNLMKKFEINQQNISRIERTLRRRIKMKESKQIFDILLKQKQSKQKQKQISVIRRDRNKSRRVSSTKQISSSRRKLDKLKKNKDKR